MNDSKYLKTPKLSKNRLNEKQPNTKSIAKRDLKNMAKLWSKHFSSKHPESPANYSKWLLR